MTAGFFCGRRFFIIEDFYGGAAGVVPNRDVSKGNAVIDARRGRPAWGSTVVLWRRRTRRWTWIPLGFHKSRTTCPTRQCHRNYLYVFDTDDECGASPAAGKNSPSSGGSWSPYDRKIHRWPCKRYIPRPPPDPDPVRCKPKYCQWASSQSFPAGVYRRMWSPLSVADCGESGEIFSIKNRLHAASGATSKIRRWQWCRPILHLLLKIHGRTGRK